MKHLTVLLLTCLLFSFTHQTKSPFQIKKIEKSFSRISDNLLVNKYEVSNIDYRIFITDFSLSHTAAAIRNILPDTSVWRQPDNYNEPLVSFYFRNKAYDNYPVVGVTYDAAVEYCDWLTKKYNQEEKRKFEKVFFRLLTKQEWELAANGGDPSKVFTWGGPFLQNNRKCDLCNYRKTVACYDSATKKNKEEAAVISADKENRFYFTVERSSYFPSSFGMYNMCGNVAEMIQEKGLAKGGSYRDSAYDVRIASERTYTSPTADIGFRIAMEILEK